MRRCIVGRNSICATNFFVSCRSFSSCEAKFGTATSLSKDQLANLKLLSTSIAGQENEDGLQVSEDRPPATRTSSARPFLPLSPLMDPEYIAAKEKHHIRKPKPPPLEERTPFQLDLQSSPYAQALSTPVRQCQVTELCLPRFFLQDFEILAHPETKQPWLLPRSLANSAANGLERDTKGTRAGPKSYAISRATLFTSFGKKGTAFSKGDERLFTPRMQFSAPKFINVKNLKHRKRLEFIVLELMRRRLVESLVVASENCVACNGYEDVKELHQVGAVLWFGDSKGHTGTKVDFEQIEGADAISVDPEDFSTLDIDQHTGSKIPVHNLQRILGRKHIQKLKELSSRFPEKGIMALKHNEATLEVQLKLWKFQCHLFGLADEELERLGSIDIDAIKQ